MQRHEFKVIPAPRRGEKARGVKTTEERFALALTALMNEMAAEGWDYVRAETLPVDERAGLTGTKTTFQNVLVFRRALAEAVVAPAMAQAEALPVRRVGPADVEAGVAPPVGPATPGMAAE